MSKLSDRLGIVTNKISFDTATEIPVIVVFVICNWTYLQDWNQTLSRNGLCALFLRRGYKVSAMQGLWSCVAGVQDFCLQHPVHIPYDILRFKVVEEIEEEIGWDIHFSDVSVVGKATQINPKKPSVSFIKDICVAKVDLKDGSETPKIQLDWEHIGAIWVPVGSLLEFYHDGVVNNENLGVILKDGVTPDFNNNLECLVRYFQ